MKLRLPSEQQQQYNAGQHEYEHYLERRQTEEDILQKLNQIKGKSYAPHTTRDPIKVFYQKFFSYRQTDDAIIEKIKNNNKYIEKKWHKVEREQQELAGDVQSKLFF